MKTANPVTTLLIAASLTSLSNAAPKAAKEQAVPKTAAEILALSTDKLTEKLGNTSEVGQDQAARLWATAKRIDTEGKLAKKDVALVPILDEWRDTLDRWQDSLMFADSFESGGGTMYSHQSARNNAELEIFLAKHVDGLTKMLDEPVKLQPIDLKASSVARIDKAAKERKDEKAEGLPSDAEVKKELKEAEEALLIQISLISDKATREAVIAWAKESVKFAENF